MSYKEGLKKNISKNYLFLFLNNFGVTQGVWMIYLASRGLSLTEIGILEAIFHITSFLMEIPTGAVADIWGRRISRIAGRAVQLISAILIVYSNSYIGFVIGFIFSALSYNLESGAGDALIYDSLKEIREEESYMKISGKNEVIMQLAQTCGLILGGFLYNYSYIYAYGVSIVITIIAMMQALFFTEPKIKMEVQEKSFNTLKSQVVDSFNIIRKNKRLAFLILSSQGIFMFNTSIFFYFQNYLSDKGVSKGTIGIILAIAALAAAILASQGHKIEKKIGERVILALLPIIMSLCIWGVALSRYHYLFFLAINCIESLIFVVVSDYINKLIPSDKRATILSMASMIFSFYMIIIFPIIGKLGDVFSLKVAFEILAIVANIIAIINLMVFVKRGE